MAASVKPRISDQVISQVIVPATFRAWPSASRTAIAGPGFAMVSSCRRQCSSS